MALNTSLASPTNIASPSRMRRFSLWVGIIAMLLLIDANTRAIGITFTAGMSADVQMGLWVLGVFGMAIGFGLRGIRVTRMDAYLMFAFFLGAFILRLMGLGDYLRTLVDELNTISGVTSLWNRPDQRLLWVMSENIMPYPWHYVWLHEQNIAIFGRSLFGLRVLDAMMGAGSVAVTYGMVRTLATRRAGIIASLVLMSLPLHLHITRLALINVTDALLLPLLVASIASALRAPNTLAGIARSRSMWLWAGIWLGMLQYFYEGGRLLSLPLVAGWLLMVVFIGKMRRRDVRGIGWMLLMFGVMVFPLVFTWSQSGAPVAGRLNITGGDSGYWLSIFNARLGDGWLETLLDQVMRAFAVYIFLPDQSGFYMGDTAMLLPFVVPFALLGVIASLWWRAHLRVVLLLWVVGFSLANGLFLLNSAGYSRFIGVTPALAGLVGVGLEGWYLLMRQATRRARQRRALAGDASRRSRQGTRWRSALLLWGVALVLVMGQTVYFFGLHLPMYNVDYRLVRPYPDVDDAILRASQQLPIGTQVHLVMPHTPSDDEDLEMVWAMIGAGQAYGREFMRLLRDDINTVTVPSSQLESYIEGLNEEAGHAFFIAVDDDASAIAIIRAFPSYTTHYTTDSRIPSSKAMVMYYVAPIRTLVENPHPPAPSPISLR
jgi:4-amino-4-deoxy-L-arabinose transferase-like glycosyltransferase